MHWPALRRINALRLAPPACLGNPDSLRSGRAVVHLGRVHSCLLIPIFIRYSIPRCSIAHSPIYNRLMLLSVIWVNITW